MTCKERQTRFSDLIKGDLSGTERIDLIDHIRACALCKDEYLLLLKFHYTLEKENVTVVPEIKAEDFKTKIQQRINNGIPVTHRRDFRWIFTLAAILLTGAFLVTILVTKKTEVPVTQTEMENKTLVRLLETEDWNTLFTIITSPSGRYSYADEKVPLSLIIEKLYRLQKTGFQKIKLKYLLVQTDSKATALRTFALIPRQNWPILNKKHEISSAELIFLLKKIARYKKTISLRQISEMYYLLNERTVKL